MWTLLTIVANDEWSHSDKSADVLLLLLMQICIVVLNGISVASEVCYFLLKILDQTFVSLSRLQKSFNAVMFIISMELESAAFADYFHARAILLPVLNYAGLTVKFFLST